MESCRVWLLNICLLNTMDCICIAFAFWVCDDDFVRFSARFQRLNVLDIAVQELACLGIIPGHGLCSLCMYESFAYA